ncbi:MAG: FkbM family methyltransferase [Arcobacteraceae bacterium]|jgi:FkbM family methyltransferase|nr:FkbM family methyltransferase [Arcobacteraceae bacterium]
MNGMKQNKLIFSDFFTKNYKVIYADIGASGGLINPWDIFDKENLKVIGFEPDKSEYEKLSMVNPNNQYYNIGLWSTNEVRKFYIMENGISTSSLYPPNLKLNSMHLEHYNVGRTISRVIEVPCDSLDCIIINKNDIPDFIKIDTQGSEYEILKGAQNLLTQNTLLVTAETWIEEYYLGAPTMEKIILLMKSFGYNLFGTEPAAARKFRNSRNIEDKSRQHMAGFELLFIKDFEKLKFNNSDRFVVFIALLELYAYRSYAIYILENTSFIDNNLKNTLLDILYANAVEEPQIYPRLR